VTPSEPRRVRLNLILYVLVLAAAAVAVVVGVAVVDDVRDDPTPSSLPADGAVRPVALAESADEEQERIAAVIESASTEVLALLNVRYDDPETSFDAVLAGATGAFRTQFEKSTKDLDEKLAESESVQESEVLWTGIVAADPDSATVNVAASGTVSNTFTEGKAEARNYRLQLELVLTDGAWLTRDLQFVG
jgi:Mce-associated membrane protein